MLRLMHVEEIEGLLLGLPELVRRQERRAPEFTRLAGAWLDSLEGVFVANRLYQAGLIAALRSGIVAAEHGQAPAGLEFRSRPSRSRVLNAVASQALQRAAEVASAVIAEHRPRLAEAERVAQRIVAAALSRGLIGAPEAGVNTTEYLRMLRRSFAASGDVESAVVHLEGLVGPHDALALVDRALAPYLDAAPRGPRAVTRPSPG